MKGVSELLALAFQVIKGLCQEDTFGMVKTIGAVTALIVTEAVEISICKSEFGSGTQNVEGYAGKGVCKVASDDRKIGLRASLKSR